MWTNASNLNCKVGENSIEDYLKEASEHMLEIASMEEEEMNALLENTSNL
jgi:hypothetical protein